MSSCNAMGWHEGDYLIWRSILSTMPKEWKEKLRENHVRTRTNECIDKERKIFIEGEMISIKKATSKIMYTNLVKKKACKPTAQKNIEKKLLASSDIEWKLVYRRIYTSTIDTRLRAFQYKIINNCLYLNQKLFKFGLVESPLCSFCKKYPESMLHMYVECTESKVFYAECRDWLKSVDLCFPEMTVDNILLGYSDSSFVNYLFVLWKFVLYKWRVKQRIPVLQDFEDIVKQYECIEYKIAEKKTKLTSHFMKYEKIYKLLN